MTTKKELLQYIGNLESELKKVKDMYKVLDNRTQAMVTRLNSMSEGWGKIE